MKRLVQCSLLASFKTINAVFDAGVQWFLFLARIIPTNVFNTAASFRFFLSGSYVFAIVLMLCFMHKQAPS